MGFLSNPSERIANDMLQLLSVHLEKQENYMLAIADWHAEHRRLFPEFLRLQNLLNSLAEDQKKMDASVKNELARNQEAINKVVVDTEKAVRNEVLTEMRSDRGRVDNMAASVNEVLAAIRKGGPLFSDLRASLSAQGEVMAEYSTDLSKTKKENLRLYEEVKRVKKALSVAEKQILDLEQDKLFPEPSPTEPYELIDLETGEQTSVVPRQLPTPVKAKAAEDDLKNKAKGERDEMRELMEAVLYKLESLEEHLKGMPLDSASEQPQEPPSTAPTSRSVPTEAPPVAPALPAPVVAVQYVPKLEEVLNHPNAAQLGKKSIRLLQELAGIMDRKALFVFTHDNVQDWLDISRGTSYGHIASWQKFGFIEKKGSLYRFVPPPAIPPTQPQEDSQPVEGA